MDQVPANAGVSAVEDISFGTIQEVKTFVLYRNMFICLTLAHAYVLI
jgi:hypothetical protein